MPDSSTNKNFIELDALFKRADDVVATSVIGRPRRGSGYIPKVDAKIRLNAEVMAWLKDMGPRHYSRINGLLTALMEEDKRRQAVAVESDGADVVENRPGSELASEPVAAEPAAAEPVFSPVATDADASEF